MLWIIGGIIALILLCYGIDVYRNRHSLNVDEIARLAQKRRRNRALYEYRFCSVQRPADPAEKKAMKSAGEFVSCDLDYNDAPSRIAGLLKYKKHEWIVIAFISAKRVIRLWWNKGSDRTQVRSLLRDHAFERTLRLLRPDAVAILHNHPNFDPSRYRMSLPSDVDLNTASFCHQQLAPQGISLLEFICERGAPHLYYAGFSGTVVTIEPILKEIQSLNGTGIFKNYSLRKELRTQTRGEQIAGSNLPPPVGQF